MFSQGMPLDKLMSVALPKNVSDLDTFAKLKPGTILHGTVLKSTNSQGAPMARFAGQDIPLPQNTNLPPGQPITAEVVKVANQILLKMVAPEAKGNLQQALANAPKAGPSTTGTLVLTPPENLSPNNILSTAKPGDILTGTVVKNLGANQAIIKFGGTEIPASSSQALTAGQTITAKVESNLPQVTLKILQEGASASGKGNAVEMPIVPQTKANLLQEMLLKLRPNQWKEGQPATPLKEGQVVEVKVVRLTPGNKAVMEIQGKLVEAPVPKGIEAGKTISMSVESRAPELTLQPLKLHPQLNMEKAAGLIRELLPSKEPLDQVMNRLAKLLTNEKLPASLNSERKVVDGLRQALSDAVVPKPGKPDAALLQKAFDQSGQNYEAKIKTALEKGFSPEEIKNITLKGDLKGELMKLSKVVEEKVATMKVDSREAQVQIRDLQNLANTLRTAGNQIELNQVMNAVNHREDGTVHFQIPYLSENGRMKSMEVFVRKNGEGQGEGNGEKDDCNVTLLLDMTSLGSLRADVHISEGSIHCKFISQNEEVVKFIDAGLPLLESKLQEFGYQARLETGLTEQEKVVSPVVSEQQPINQLGLLSVKV